jgi:hypothetical protein
MVLGRFHSGQQTHKGSNDQCIIRFAECQRDVSPKMRTRPTSFDCFLANVEEMLSAILFAKIHKALASQPIAGPQSHAQVQQSRRDFRIRAL